MKSSSSVLRSSENLDELLKWSPVEFEQDDKFSEELIRTSALNFFGKSISGFSEQKRNLFKVDQNTIDFQQWQPADMNEISQKSQRSTPQAWTPFLDTPNPKKIANELVENAKMESDVIVKTAQEKANQIEQEANNKGLENSKNEMKETLQAASAVINVAREWRNDMMNQAEPMIMDLVKKIAQKMFGDGIVLDNVTLQQHFASVLESARSLDDLRIYMNPFDAKELGPDWREYQASVLGHKVEIVSNESIKRGGCYIQGEWGTADALVETQLNTILTQFSEVEQPPKDEE